MLSNSDAGDSAVVDSDSGPILVPGDGGANTPTQLTSLEVGRTHYGPDYSLRSDAPAGGTLFSVWTRILDPGNSYPWSRGNMDVYVLRGSNWHFRCLVGNSSAQSASDARYNANSMLFSDPDGGWLGDFSYFESSGGNPEAPYRGWVWAAWQIVVGNDAFIVRQWLKFGEGAPVQAAGSSEITFASARATMVVNGVDPGVAAAWTPSDATGFQVGSDWGFLNRAHMIGRASQPSLDELEAIASHTHPNTAAWADYPFAWTNGAPDLTDVSGNGRDLSLYSGGVYYAGPAGPDL